MVRIPPFSMAAAALLIIFINTCSICCPSPLTLGRSSSMSVLRSIFLVTMVFMITLTTFWRSSTTSVSVVVFSGILAKVRRFSMILWQLFACLSIVLRISYSLEPSGDFSISISVKPRMIAMGLFISWATPAERDPRDASFSVWKSWSSMVLCSVMSLEMTSTWFILFPPVKTGLYFVSSQYSLSPIFTRSSWPTVTRVLKTLSTMARICSGFLYSMISVMCLPMTSLASFPVRRL